MISVIVCSINDRLLQQLKINIAEGIGIPFELIAVDNNKIRKSISAVYNEAARSSKFNFLCFVHEDVIIHSKGWGEKLVELLNDETIGLVGVSGAVYKSKYPGTWSACDRSLYRTNSIQHFKNTSHPVTTNINPHNKGFEEVAVIDGVFMATQKDLFYKNQFDEALLAGFHGYDIDYSMQVGRSHKVVVTYDILLEHLSEGTLSKEWLDSSILVHNKWKEKLPRSVSKISKKVEERSDYLSNQCVLNIALGYKQEWLLVTSFFLRMLLKYFHYNKLRYSRKVILFLLSKQ